MKNILKLAGINIALLCIYNVIPIFSDITLSSNTIDGNIHVADVQEQNVKKFELTLTSDLRKKSYLSASDYDKMLKNTALNGLGNALEQAENDYNVNGLYLMGLACLESAYGNSGYARQRNNLVGWNAVDSNPDKATYFKSKDECILFVASKLKKNYLTQGGCYFEGYTAKDIDVHYCTDKQHASKIVAIVNKLVKNMEG